MFVDLAQLIVPLVKMKILAQAVLLDSLFPQSILLQLSLTQCVRKPAVMEEDLSTLVMTETQTTMMAAMISVKSSQDGVAPEEQPPQKVFV